MSKTSKEDVTWKTGFGVCDRFSPLNRKDVELLPWMFETMAKVRLANNLPKIQLRLEIPWEDVAVLSSGRNGARYQILQAIGHKSLGYQVPIMICLTGSTFMLRDPSQAAMVACDVFRAIVPTEASVRVQLLTGIDHHDLYDQHTDPGYAQYAEVASTTVKCAWRQWRRGLIAPSPSRLNRDLWCELFNQQLHQEFSAFGIDILTGSKQPPRPTKERPLAQYWQSMINLLRLHVKKKTGIQMHKQIIATRLGLPALPGSSSDRLAQYEYLGQALRALNNRVFSEVFWYSLREHPGDENFALFRGKNYQPTKLATIMLAGHLNSLIP